MRGVDPNKVVGFKWTNHSCNVTGRGIRNMINAFFQNFPISSLHFEKPSSLGPNSADLHEDEAEELIPISCCRVDKDQTTWLWMISIFFTALFKSHSVRAYSFLCKSSWSMNWTSFYDRWFDFCQLNSLMFRHKDCHYVGPERSFKSQWRNWRSWEEDVIHRVCISPLKVKLLKLHKWFFDLKQTILWLMAFTRLFYPESISMA